MFLPYLSEQNVAPNIRWKSNQILSDTAKHSNTSLCCTAKSVTNAPSTNIILCFYSKLEGIATSADTWSAECIACLDLVSSELPTWVAVVMWADEAFLPFGQLSLGGSGGPCGRQQGAQLGEGLLALQLLAVDDPGREALQVRILAHRRHRHPLRCGPHSGESLRGARLPSLPCLDPRASLPWTASLQGKRVPS